MVPLAPLTLLLLLSWTTPLLLALSSSSLRRLREETRESFFHAFNSYLLFAYPHDELLPLSCAPRTLNKTRGTLDDVLGGYLLTLVDSLDSLLVMREWEVFEEMVERVRHDLSFDRDVSVSVFEANIRVLGGLLSAHQLAVTLSHSKLVSYDGEVLLEKAVELADRLLPAFDSPTDIPYHVVHLQDGVLEDVSSGTCPAAGGSFLLEMGLLSRLTGNPIYANKARRATNAIWKRKSKLNLVGSMIDVESGKWLQTHTGIGAGIDSFYETMFKDDTLHDQFIEAYEAVHDHSVIEGWHMEVDMHKGKQKVFSYYFSALQAFWPSLQVVSGRVKDGVEAFHGMSQLWYKYKALPDIYDHRSQKTLHYAKDYPLRPEMIESAYHLFKATGDKKYLYFAKDFLTSLQTANRVKCGFASSKNVERSASELYHKGRRVRSKFASTYKRHRLLDDRMDSYFLAETLKYLFLIFDEALPPHERASFFCQPSGRPGVPISSSREVCALNISSESPPPPGEASVQWEDSSQLPLGCIDRQQVVLSTEGHVFLMEKSTHQPPLDISERSNRSKSEGGGRSKDLLVLHTCPASFVT